MSSTRLGIKVVDSTVLDLRALNYDPRGTIQFKISLSSSWQNLTTEIRL